MRLRERLRAALPAGAGAIGVLVVTSVDAERDAVLSGLPHATPPPGEPPASAPTESADSQRPRSARVRVEAVGVGPAAAAAGTARLLALAEAAGHGYDLVINAGIAGGIVGRAEIGATVAATRVRYADLGADSPDGFLSIDALDLGSSSLDCDEDVLAVLRSRRPDLVVGEVLTVTTATGTRARAEALAACHPGAVAEAMEGFGVAWAAARAGVAFAEIRTIANAVGPRDRAAWRIGPALSALTAISADLEALTLLFDRGGLGAG
jgi:futalosine hydrolase